MICKLREKVKEKAPEVVRIWSLKRVSPLWFQQVSVRDRLFDLKLSTEQLPSFVFVLMGWNKMRTDYFQYCWGDNCHQLSHSIDRTGLSPEKALPCLYLGNGKTSSINWAHCLCRSSCLQTTSVSWMQPCGSFLLEFGTRPNTFMTPGRASLSYCVNATHLGKK